MNGIPLDKKYIEVGCVGAGVPPSPMDQLLSALARQTQAMLELAESNRLLAESNREMVDYLADQQGDDSVAEVPRRDLAGRPI